MIPVDNLLSSWQEFGRPIGVGLVGAGFSGRHLAHQINTSTPGLRVVAISNRNLATAIHACEFSGMEAPVEVSSAMDPDLEIRKGRTVVTRDPFVVCRLQEVDAIIEATGTIEFGASVVAEAIRRGKHVIVANAELDSTVGPALAERARQAGVVYTNIAGDEPGAAMDLVRFVRAIGLRPVVAGNLKGLYDRYRNPGTQRDFAKRVSQDPAKIASYADGTKLSMELCVLANATGFGVARRGMYGPSLKHVDEAAEYFCDKVDVKAPVVDFLVGAAPGSGVFVGALAPDSVKARYLEYLKMGKGPLYIFYRHFHLPQMEAPISVARAVVYKDATIKPLGPPVCEAVAVAKRELLPGEVIDGLGGFCCYGMLESYEAASQMGAVPIGLAPGHRVKKRVGRDQVVTLRDLEPRPLGLVDILRDEQHDLFINQNT